MDLHEPGSNLSTPWPAYYFKNLHIPLSYEMPLLTAQLSTPPDPPFPTPVAFGDPLEVGGWKDKRPSWVVAVLQLVPLKFTTQFKSFDSPVVMSADELSRLRMYSQTFGQPSRSSTIITLNSPPPPSGNDIAPEGSDPSSPESNVPSYSNSYLQHSNSHGGENCMTGGSPAWHSLFASDAVRQAHLSNQDKHSAVFLISSDDEDGDEDDSSEWVDNMDPVTFARYYANTIPQFAKIVQDHNRESHARLNRKITNWAGGVVLRAGPSEDWGRNTSVGLDE